jgi:hypothetical protein
MRSCDLRREFEIEDSVMVMMVAMVVKILVTLVVRGMVATMRDGGHDADGSVFILSDQVKHLFYRCHNAAPACRSVSVRRCHTLQDCVWKCSSDSLR